MRNRIDIPGVLLGPALGSGGSGVVYEGTDRRSGAPLAVKLVEADRGMGRQRALQEAELSWSLNHPHVVRVLRWGELPDRSVFIVMERLYGQTLGALLDRELRLPLARVLDIGRQVARGLVAIHGIGAVHRDVKPSNVWLGEDGVVRLLDLGVARLSQADPRRRAETSYGAIVGTPGYLAPEQLASGRCDSRTDLFALGATLFEALTGESPFGPGDVLVVMRKVLEAREPPVMPGGLPLPLAGLLSAMLHPNPESRPPGAESVQLTLDALSGATLTPFEGETVGVDETIPRSLDPPPPDDEEKIRRFRERLLAVVAHAFPPDAVPAEVDECLHELAERSDVLSAVGHQTDLAMREVQLQQRRLDSEGRALDDARERFEREHEAARDATLRCRLELDAARERLQRRDDAWRAGYEKGTPDGLALADRQATVEQVVSALERLGRARRKHAGLRLQAHDGVREWVAFEARRESRMAQLESELAGLTERRRQAALAVADALARLAAEVRRWPGR